MQILAVVAVLALLGVAGFVFFRGGDGHVVHRGKSGPPSANLDLELGGIRNESTGGPANLEQPAADQIMDLVGTYVDAGLIEPLKTGKPPNQDVFAIFDQNATARLKSNDHTFVFEEGMPKLTGDLEAKATPIILTALADPLGQIQLVTASFVYDAVAPTKDGKFAINRSIELTFVPDGQGSWKVTGYDVSVGRQPATATTTTAVPAS